MPPRLRFTNASQKTSNWPTALALSLDVSWRSRRSTWVRVHHKSMYRRMLMEVERAGWGFNVFTDRERLERKSLRRTFTRRASPVLALLRRPDCIATRTSVCIGEGVTARETAQEPVIAYCASRGHSAVLIPDYTFINSKGYRDLNHWAALNRREWSGRSSTVLWRGATSGSGTISNPEMTGDELIPRVQMCLLAKSIDGADMKLVNIAQSDNPDLDRDRFGQAEIMGEHLPVEAWAAHKFAIDIDGNTNSFGTMLPRLLLGCCVLKVGSTMGWRQWYYDSVEPWVHFIPIEPDLSDLAEKIAWCRDHDQECQRIAAEGRAFANGLNYNSEIESAVRRINTAFARSD